MKKLLLLAAASLVFAGANAAAPLTKSSTAKPMKPLQMPFVKPSVFTQPMYVDAPCVNLLKAPKRANSIDVYYTRPAGAYPGTYILEDGALTYSTYAAYIHMTPYADYTFHGYIDGASDAAEIYWDYQYYSSSAGGYVWDALEGEKDLTIQYGYELDSVPVFTVYDGDTFDQFYLCGHNMGGTYDKPTISATYYSYICAVPSTMDVWSQDFMWSSKNFSGGGLFGTNYYTFTYYSGAYPYGYQEGDEDSSSGYWFGKNGSHIDGIGEVFEKPEHPYLLRNVYLYTTQLAVSGNVDMTCKIYKLEQSYPYSDTSNVVLPGEPGELIATGRASLTKQSPELDGGLVTFTLYGEEDGLEYEITPTIDYPIMVVVDGYNDESMSAITNFSALIGADTETDEGFGEMAFLKYPLRDENGEYTGEYCWRGLNNFFSGGTLEMKTGFTIFITADKPYLTFNYYAEDGYYKFPNAGGVMEKQIAEGVTTRSIEFFSYMPSVDEGWTLSCDGGDVPEWLTIDLTDGATDGEFNGLVTALVTADALPDGITGRRAVVRFEFPGAYLDYTFEQGDVADRKTGDVNGDGEVTIADVNAIVDYILNGGYDQYADVNGDGEVTIADVNAVVDIILSAED